MFLITKSKALVNQLIAQDFVRHIFLEYKLQVGTCSNTVLWKCNLCTKCIHTYICTSIISRPVKVSHVSHALCDHQLFPNHDPANELFCQIQTESSGHQC